MKEIITHSGQAHRDDFLACCLLLAATGAPVIERRDEVTETELADPQIAVVDIGGSFDLKLNNYDHHHDPNLPCSLHLVAAGLFARSDFSDVFLWWDNVSIQDTQGFPTLARKYGLEPRQLQELADPVGGAVLKAFSSCDSYTPEHSFYWLWKEIGEGLISNIRSFQDGLRAMRMESAGDIYVAVTRRKDNAARFAFAREHGLKIIVAPNERGPGFTLTRVDDAPGVDFRRCEGMENVTFIHHTGFMCVVESLKWNWRPYVEAAITKEDA